MKCPGASVTAAGFVDCDDGRKRDPERYAQIHSGTLDQYIANFDAVRETLSGHPVFGPYLDPLGARNASRSTSPPKLALAMAPSRARSVATAARFRLQALPAALRGARRASTRGVRPTLGRRQ